jgi:hypothetical protein
MSPNGEAFLASESDEKKHPAVETDPRFPSGEWKGFWLQRGLSGRQWMTLALEFRAGHLAGEGRDSVGEFFLRGDYSLDTGIAPLPRRTPGVTT